MAALNSSADSKKFDSKRRVSCETFCSSNSSCVLQKRKPLHPLASSLKIKNNGSSVRQRVLSAKFLRLKTLQNELNDANYHIAQLLNENKILKNLQRKQDSALAKYEGTSAELPRVLESYQEEIRVLQARNKIFRKNIKDLNEQTKVKDEEITSLRDQNKHLTNLCKNKNLEERDKLSKKVEELEDLIKQRDTTISTLNRKIALETKNCKFKVTGEANKNKLLQKELQRATRQIDDLKILLEAKDRGNSTKDRRIVSNNTNKKALIVKLNGFQEKNDPIAALEKKQSNNGSASSLNIEDTDSSSSLSNVALPQTTHNEVKEKKDHLKNGPATSEMQLKKVVNSWQKKKQDSVEITDEKFVDFPDDLLKVAKNTYQSMDKNVQEYEKCSKKTEAIISVLKESDDICSKLGIISKNDKKLLDYEEFLKDKNSNLLAMKEKEAIRQSGTYNTEERYSAGKSHRTKINPEVDNENKEKLLAKLRAIDNGESIEFSNVKKTKNDLLKELFG